jgi:formylglycine-generating enzyme
MYTKRLLAGLVVAGLVMGAIGIAQAEVPTGTLTVADLLDQSAMVQVLNAGNTGDAANPQTLGAVSYDFTIGKYEVTQGQWAEFLNSVAGTSDTYGLFSYDATTQNITRSGAGTVEDPWTYAAAANNLPVGMTTFWDAARFVNWMNTGDTENGAYTLGGYAGSNGSSIVRNASLVNAFVLPSANEWHKAAYYDPALNSGAGGYWSYGTQSNTQPSNVLTDPTVANLANWKNSTLTTVGLLTNSDSAYGAFDMMGNIHEWNDTVKVTSPTTNRITMSGWFSMPSTYASVLLNTRYSGGDPGVPYQHTGFRVAFVPEPSSLVMVVLGAIATLGWALRKRS